MTLTTGKSVGYISGLWLGVDAIRVLFHEMHQVPGSGSTVQINDDDNDDSTDGRSLSLCSKNSNNRQQKLTNPQGEI